MCFCFQKKKFKTREVYSFSCERNSFKEKNTLRKASKNCDDLFFSQENNNNKEFNLT